MQSIVSGGSVTDSSFSSGSTSGGVTGFSGTGGLSAAALAGGCQALGGTAAAVQPEAAAAQASQGGNQPAPTPPPTKYGWWDWIKDTFINTANEATVPPNAAALEAAGDIAEILTHTKWDERARRIENKQPRDVHKNWGYREHEAWKAGGAQGLRQFYKDNPPPPGEVPLIPITPPSPAAPPGKRK